MNILYRGKYRERFDQIVKHLEALRPDSKVLELCFGDIYIADHCKRIGLEWEGIDLNEKFVKFAKRQGYAAHLNDLIAMDELPKADVCIMAGSLYHFHPDYTFKILKKMFDAANRVIISEPVENLSSRKGILGILAKRAASVGKGHEEFRFDLSSLLLALKKYSTPLHFAIVGVQSIQKDTIVILEKQ